MTANRTADIVLKAENLGKVVPTANGPLTILKGINLEIKRGESIAVIGVSGSGKSTLLGLLAGLDTPTTGDVVLDDHRFSTLDEDGRARVRSGHVGFVFQTFHLLPNLTARENVMMPLELSGSLDPGTEAEKLLARVGLEGRLQHYPNQLSGGEQQRVAIARAYAGRPSILFADEPTGNLDRETGKRVIELLFDLNREQQATLVLVTHDEQVADRCQRHIHLDAGRIFKESS